jgi:uncharacterized membrane protein
MELEYFRPTGKHSALDITLLALMTALVTVMTAIIQIPYPGTSGYFNLGDAMVMLSGVLLGPIGGFFAGGVGSALGDVVGGYAFWAPITFFIKGFEGMAVGYLSFRTREHIRLNKWDIIAVLIGAAIMLTGYFVAQVLLYDFVVALGELVSVNLPQVVIGGVVTLLIGPTVSFYLRSFNYDGHEDLAELPSENLLTE